MPSKSTNLHKQTQPDKRKRDATQDAVKARPAKAAKSASIQSPATAVIQEAPKPAEKVVDEAAPEEDTPKDSALPDNEEGEDSNEEEAAAADDNEDDTEEAQAEGDDAEPVEPLPTKEEIEADKELSEGARLGELFLCYGTSASHHHHRWRVGGRARANRSSSGLVCGCLLSSSHFLSSPFLLALLYATLFLRFNPSPKYTPPTNPGKKSMKKSGPLPLDPYSEQQNFFQSDFTPADPTFELTEKQWAQKKKASRAGAAKKGDGVSGERWKFNKQRESWLMRHVCHENQVSKLGLVREMPSPNPSPTFGLYH